MRSQVFLPIGGDKTGNRFPPKAGTFQQLQPHSTSSVRANRCFAWNTEWLSLFSTASLCSPGTQTPVDSHYLQLPCTQLRFTLESDRFHLSKTSQTENPKDSHRARPAPGSRERVTSDSLIHIFSCQPSSGGDSGRNTQSAPQAKALAKARYLHGNN